MKNKSEEQKKIKIRFYSFSTSGNDKVFEDHQNRLKSNL